LKSRGVGFPKTVSFIYELTAIDLVAENPTY